MIAGLFGDGEYIAQAFIAILGCGENLAKKFNCCAVLKGGGSIFAVSGGKRYINTSGNPGLSSAGTGDVLSGIVGALLIVLGITGRLRTFRLADRELT